MMFSYHESITHFEIGKSQVSVQQVQYSVLDRRPENGMVAYAREHGIRLATFGTQSSF